MKTVTKDDMSDVQAVRNGIERTFTRQVWNLLGPNKDGYSEVVATPKELKEPKPPVDPKQPTQPKAPKAPIAQKLSVAAQKKLDAETLKNAGKPPVDPKASNPDDLASKINENGGE